MIIGLQRDLDDARGRFANFVGTKPTKVKLDPDGSSIRSDQYPRFLPERSSIEFALEAGEIETRLEDEFVRVIASGNSQLVVEPESSNVVRLRLIQEG
jgi:hypothetical protein